MFINIKESIIKTIISMSIFAVTIFFTPNFNMSNISILIISSLFVSIVDYLAATITNIHDYPIGRSIVSFFSFSIILYACQFFIAGYTISLMSSLIASFIYGFFSYFIQEEKMEL